MSDSEFVTAIHTGTGIVSSVPRSFVESVYPDLYRELSDAEVVELRRKAEFELYGHNRTPAPEGPVVSVAAQALAAPVVEAPPVIEPATVTQTQEGAE